MAKALIKQCNKAPMTKYKSSDPSTHKSQHDPKALGSINGSTTCMPYSISCSYKKHAKQGGSYQDSGDLTKEWPVQIVLRTLTGE